MPQGIALPSASVGKSCTRTGGGVPFGCHSRPAFLKFPTSSFFFVSTEITGCPRGQKLVRGRVDVLELRVPIGVNGAFLSFAHRLQPVTQLAKKPTHRGRTHAPALLRQRRRELRATLARPAQRRCRVPPCHRVHERLERGENAGLILLNPGSPRPRRPNAARRRFAADNLPASLADRLARQTGGRRHQRVAAIADGHGLRRRPPSATALVQHGCHRDVFRNDGGLQLHVPLHAASMSEKPRDSNLILVTVLSTPQAQGVDRLATYDDTKFWPYTWQPTMHHEIHREFHSTPEGGHVSKEIAEPATYDFSCKDLKAFKMKVTVTNKAGRVLSGEWSKER